MRGDGRSFYSSQMCQTGLRPIHLAFYITTQKWTTVDIGPILDRGRGLAAALVGQIPAEWSSMPPARNGCYQATALALIALSAMA